MRKKYRSTGIMFFVLAFSVFNIMLAMNIKPSLAVDPESGGNGFPSSTFTSNITNNTKVNYIKDAITAANENSNYSASFDVIKDFHVYGSDTPLYSLMKNLQIPKTTEKFEIKDDSPSTIQDNGLLYIMTHGYNATNPDNNIFSSLAYGAVADNTIKEYVTQIAIWLYIYEKKSSFSHYCSNNECVFYDSSNAAIPVDTIKSFISHAASVNGYNYLNYITALVDQAKAYTGAQESKMASLSAASFSYTINEDFTSLKTDTITPQVTSNQDNFLYYSIEIDDPNSYGAYITDVNNHTISNPDRITSSFKVVVPLKEDLSTMDLTSIKVHVYAHFLKPTGNEYRVTDSTNPLIDSNKKQVYTNVYYGYTPNEVIETNFNLYNFTKISKIDVANSNELPGATLVITDKNDSTNTETWVSTDTPHYTYLKNGDYQLCETLAPDGYEKSTECIDFSVDGTKITSVVMENAHIPNTSAFRKTTIYIIGGILMLLGIGSFGYVMYKKKGRN